MVGTGVGGVGVGGVGASGIGGVSGTGGGNAGEGMMLPCAGSFVALGNLLFLNVTRPEPSILTLYCLWGRTSTMDPVLVQRLLFWS